MKTRVPAVLVLVVCLLLLSVLVVAAQAGERTSKLGSVGATEPRSSAPAPAMLSQSAVFLPVIMSQVSELPPKGVTVYGTVRYSTLPMPDVRVELIVGHSGDPPLLTATTDTAGFYSFPYVMAGDYWLKVYGPTAEYLAWTADPITVESTDFHRDFYLQKLMTLLSPAWGSVVDTLSPTFCWQELAEAETYTLQLNKTSDWTLVEQRTGIAETCYTTASVLENGVQYTWQVSAFDLDWHPVGRTFGAFTFTVSAVAVSAAAE